MPELNIGLIGCGNISKYHIGGYLKRQESANVIAVCDIVNKLAEQRASEVQTKNIYTDYHELLALRDVDAVDICLPHHLHYPVASAALEAGKHVLVEKPMVCGVSEAVRLVEKAEKMNLTLMVAQNQRYFPPFVRLKRLIDQGALGQIFLAVAGWEQDLSSLNMEWVKSWVTAGGGVVISLTIHQFDLLRWFMGEVRQVSSYHMTSPVNRDMNCEDTAVTILEFTSGAKANVISLYGALRQPWTTMLMLYGSEGVASIVGDFFSRETPFRIFSRVIPEYNHPEMVELEHDFTFEDSFAAEISEFIDCLLEKREPRSSGQDNLNTIRLVDAIYRSAKTKQSTQL